MNNKTNIEEHCICTTCNNKECINHNCKFDCASEEMCNCTIDGYTDQCSDYKPDIEEDIERLKEFKEYAQEMLNDMEYERPVDVTINLSEVQAIENILTDRERVLEENKNVKKILKRDIRECKTEIIASQGNKQRKELSGAVRRHIASLSGRQNEAIRLLNILEGGNNSEDR